MSQPRHVRLTDLELAELRALEGQVAVLQASLEKAREYGAYRLGCALRAHSVEVKQTDSWQLDSETGLVVETTPQATVAQS